MKRPIQFVVDYYGMTVEECRANRGCSEYYFIFLGNDGYVYEYSPVSEGRKLGSFDDVEEVYYGKPLLYIVKISS